MTPVSPSLALGIKALGPELPGPGPLALGGASSFGPYLLVPGREAQASWALSGLVADGKFLLHLCCAFWSLGSWKLSAVLNYSETHISFVSKKSTPMGKKCHKLFIALCFESGVGGRAWQHLWLLEANLCGPLGVNDPILSS